ncbi:MAG TPA: type II toxin-antitoxin system RelE/ParE family toxin [Terracidiphilus sp.]|nr:type II toxin-antitoxin system RelE/ParE family toxin [Terracidiphilus sp.]
MAWTIEYAKTARDQLRKLDKAVARRIVDYLDTRVAPLQDARQAGKALHGPLGDLWRYRIGDYRIICDIHDRMLIVLVLQIGKRSDVYR